MERSESDSLKRSHSPDDRIGNDKYRRTEQQSDVRTSSSYDGYRRRGPSYRGGRFRGRGQRSQRSRFLRGRDRGPVVELNDEELFGGLRLMKSTYAEALGSFYSPEEVDKKYEKYCEDYKVRKVNQFFQDHKEDEWFVERYERSNAEEAYKKWKEEIWNDYNEFLKRLNTEGVTVFCFDGKSLRRQELEAMQNPSSPNVNVETEEKKDEESEEKKEDEDSNSDQATCILRLSSINTWVRVADIENLVTSLDGFVGLSVSQPDRLRHYTRKAWVRFATKEDASSAKEILHGKMIGDYELRPNYQLGPRPWPFIMHEFFSLKERMEEDWRYAREFVEKLDDAVGISGNPLLTEKYTSLPVKQRLDLLIAYLWEVHLYSYYTNEFLADKVGRDNKHISPPVRDTPREGMEVTPPRDVSIDMTYKRFDNKRVAQLHRPVRLDPRDFFLVELGKLYSIEEKKGYHRCSISEKLFVDPKFVGKHMMNKHREKVSDENLQKAKELQMRTIYLNDRFHVEPFIEEETESTRHHRPRSNQRSRPLHAYRDWDQPDNAPEDDFLPPVF